MAFQNDRFWVLSLDGGGVRALSSLIILERLMRDAGTEPAAVFTAAIGTSGGGYRSTRRLNALMIGRLGLQLSTCQEQFRNLSKQVFQNREPWSRIFGLFRNRYSHHLMETEIKRVIERAGLGQNELMQAAAGHQPRQMHVYVVCRKVEENGKLDPIHAALSTRTSRINCEVWKAGRATSAAPTYFSPQDIQNTSYVDGGLGFNNPIETINDEYKRLGFEERNKKSIYYVSIGTGKPSKEQLAEAKQYWRVPGKFTFLWALKHFPAIPQRIPGAQLAGYLKDSKAWKALLDPAMEENTHLSFEECLKIEGGHDRNAKRYFRFNCDKELSSLPDGRGLSDIELDGYGDLENIRMVTDNYLQRETAKIYQCVNQILAPAGTIAFVP